MFESLFRAEILVGVISAVISAGGAFMSLVFFRRSQQRQMQNQEVELAQWKNQYLAEIRHWADECMEALSGAVHLCDLDPSKTMGPPLFDRRHLLMQAVSSLIDRGRWFFPNEQLSADRKDRRVFFRGYRDPILDPLVTAYEVLRRLDYLDRAGNTGLRADFVAAKQDFATRMQVVLDPSSRNADFERFVVMTEELRESEKKK